MDGVRSVDVAEQLGVSKASVNKAVSTLRDAGYVEQNRYGRIQLTDTGISPGSGVGNTRAGLTLESLGVPVMAIGVPLVVYASTVAQDTIELMADETGLHNDEERLKAIAEKVISEHMGPMIMTPKDIDSMVGDMSRIIADGINLAIHDMNYDEVKALIA